MKNVVEILVWFWLVFGIVLFNVLPVDVGMVVLYFVQLACVLFIQNLVKSIESEKAKRNLRRRRSDWVTATNCYWKGFEL